MTPEPHWMLGGLNGNVEITVTIPKGRKHDPLLRRARALRRQYPSETHRQIAERLRLEFKAEKMPTLATLKRALQLSAAE